MKLGSCAIFDVVQRGEAFSFAEFDLCKGRAFLSHGVACGR